MPHNFSLQRTAPSTSDSLADNPHQVAPAKNRTHATVEILAEMILSGALPADSSLPSERELSLRLGVSRNVLREATKILQSRGLLSIRHGARTTVNSLRNEPVQQAVSGALYGSDNALVQLTEVRLTLEVSIAELAAQRATAKDIATLREFVQNLQAGISDATRYAEWDVAFHRALAEATHNSIFVLLLDSVAAMLRQSRDLALMHTEPRTSLPDHERIFEAVENHDAARAANAMRSHLERQKAAFRTYEK